MYTHKSMYKKPYWYVYVYTFESKKIFVGDCLFWKTKCPSFWYSAIFKGAGSRLHTYYGLSLADIFLHSDVIIKSAIDNDSYIYILWVVTYIKDSMTKASSFYVHTHCAKNWWSKIMFVIPKSFSYLFVRIKRLVYSES